MPDAAGGGLSELGKAGIIAAIGAALSALIASAIAVIGMYRKQGEYSKEIDQLRSDLKAVKMDLRDMDKEKDAKHAEMYRSIGQNREQATNAQSVANEARIIAQFARDGNEKVERAIEAVRKAVENLHAAAIEARNGHARD